MSFSICIAISTINHLLAEDKICKLTLIIFLCKSTDCQNCLTQVERSLQILQDANISCLINTPFRKEEIDSTRQTIMRHHGLEECNTNSYEQYKISLNPSLSQHLLVVFLLNRIFYLEQIMIYLTRLLFLNAVHQV